jgi:hypothetical protein
MLPIREIAMMSIMDKLTDKEKWHEKVFDDTIVSKWREEALAISDEQFESLAKHAKHQSWDEEGNLEIGDDLGPYDEDGLKGIMNVNAFDCVSSNPTTAKFVGRAIAVTKDGVILQFQCQNALIAVLIVHQRAQKQSEVLRKV